MMLSSSGPAVLSASASAPGKIILFGEHAVVYGVPALAASLSGMRIHVRAARVTRFYEEDDEAVSVRLDSMGDFQLDVRGAQLAAARGFVVAGCGGGGGAGDKSARTDLVAPGETVNGDVVRALGAVLAPVEASLGVKKALTSLLYLYVHLFPTHQLGGMRFHIQSKGLPVGAGLGSSAAFSVALCTALLEVVLGPSEGSVPCALSGHDGKKVDCLRPGKARLDLINAWAFMSEKLLHGTPSGLDNTTSTYGGAIAYVKEPRSIRRIDDFPELKLLITNTCVPRETSVLVGNVRALRAKHPAVIESVFTGMQRITDECVSAIETWKVAADGLEKDKALHEHLASLVSINQGLLASIGVSHPALDTVCKRAADKGLCSKLTGAGGGGCAFTLLGSGSYGALGGEERAILAGLRAEFQGEDGFVSFESGAGGLGTVIHASD
jgi:mevalonate kinase